MVNPYEGLEQSPKKPQSYWVAEVNHTDGEGYVVGVYTSEEKAMAGAVKFIQRHGWPAITDFRFNAFELNATAPRV